MEPEQVVAFSLTTVFGIVTVLALIVAVKSRRTKKPSWSIRSVNLIYGTPAPSDALEILYGGVRVNNLTVSKILFWNKGSDTIRGDDLVPLDPLRIQANEGTVLLRTNLLATTCEPGNLNIHVEGDQESATLAPDFVAAGSGPFS